MALSIFDLFSIGIGPSSSHTVGPMRAAGTFLDAIRPQAASIARLKTDLYGSLATTGIGHGTDRAVIMGLLGATPETVDPVDFGHRVDAVRSSGVLPLAGMHDVPFTWGDDMVLHMDVELPLHPNGMKFTAYDAAGGVLHEQVYYSIGGGFVVDGDAYGHEDLVQDETPVPHPFSTSAELLAHCDETGKSIARIVRDNECAWRSDDEVVAGIAAIWTEMQDCVNRGLNTEGILPGGLHVRRRAPELYERLELERTSVDPLRGLDWVTVYALAVNEENAAGGRVVTAPTNGAAGIIPAVLHYYRDFVPGANERGIRRFLLTAGAVGMIFKLGASISGAEVGCQGEVGSACAMAAAGMAGAMGATPQQVENAAEIGMEHNLGLTCDPIAGLVQVPCIERNAIAAVKAITAARTAMRGDGRHIVSLDQVIKTMRDTGYDMQSKYKETAEGGLAVNVINC